MNEKKSWLNTNLAKLFVAKKAKNNSKAAFRSLRWNLTLSYSIVTVVTLLVVGIVIIGLVGNFIMKNPYMTPDGLIESLRANWIPLVQSFISENPPNLDGARDFLQIYKGSIIDPEPLKLIGNIQLQMKTTNFISLYFLMRDLTIVDSIPHELAADEIGTRMDINYFPGLAEPLLAAIHGDENIKNLYSQNQPGNVIVGAIPIYEYRKSEIHPQASVEKGAVVGMLVFQTKSIPWDFLPLNEVIIAVLISILLITIFAGVLGSILGTFTANKLITRLSKLSFTANAWSGGDFSLVIRDNNKDEIGQLAVDLNRMAEQLENLLDRRQEISVMEERNRLARDLHDSVKQEAFAASAQLGAARAVFERDPEKAKQHLLEAEQLISKVRQELTDLIQELRPVAMKGKGLVPAVKDYICDWQKQTNIVPHLHIRGEKNLPIDIELAIFRIIQEALANVAWHSQALNVDLVFIYKPESLILTIRDDGKGFDPIHIRKNAMGLSSMHERANLIGAEFSVHSVIEHGTRIMLKYAYNKEKKA